MRPNLERNLLLLVLVIFGMMVYPLDAARGGGGRGSGGGGSRGHEAINRTPTMTRPQAQQARSQAQQQVRPQQQARPQAQQRVQQAAQNPGQVRNQVRQHSQTVKPRIDSQDLSKRQQQFSQQRRDQIQTGQRDSLQVTQRLRDSRQGYGGWFDKDFFQRHDLRPNYRDNNNVNWWKAATWGSLAGWGAWGWSDPYYYDYEGYPVTVTSYDQGVYPEQYSDPIQLQQVSDWMPLGVFAVGRNAAEAATTSRILQLAVNRTGEISGVYYNTMQDVVKEIEGTVNLQTQQAFWSLSNRLDAPIASTGLYNLTEAQTPIQVRFPDGTLQNWVLVRLQD